MTNCFTVECSLLEPRDGSSDQSRGNNSSTWLHPGERDERVPLFFRDCKAELFDADSRNSPEAPAAPVLPPVSYISAQTNLRKRSATGCNDDEDDDDDDDDDTDDANENKSITIRGRMYRERSVATLRAEVAKRCGEPRRAIHLFAYSADH